MTGFEKKQLTPTKRVCLCLKEARENANVTLQQLADQTKINIEHLKAMEECRFQDIPYASIYQRNFIKKYARALDMPSEELLAQFAEEETSVINKEDQNYKTIHRHKFHNLPSFFRSAIIAVFMLGLFFYLGSQIRAIIRPPSLTLYAPENGLVTGDYNLTVNGQTEPETTVLVNNKEISRNPDGQFTELINLSPGINTITVSAKKKHGKKAEIVRHVTLRPKQTISFNIQ